MKILKVDRWALSLNIWPCSLCFQTNDVIIKRLSVRLSPNMFICSVPQVPWEALATPAHREALGSLAQRVNLATLVTRVTPVHLARLALLAQLVPLVHPVVPVVPARLGHLVLVVDLAQQGLQASKDLKASLAILVSSWWHHAMLRHFPHQWSFVGEIYHMLVDSSKND